MRRLSLLMKVCGLTTLQFSGWGNPIPKRRVCAPRPGVVSVQLPCLGNLGRHVEWGGVHQPQRVRPQVLVHQP